MTRQEYFEHFYADQHDIPAESLQQYRWVNQDGYRLPGIATAYRSFYAGADSRQPEVDRICRESRNDAVAYKALAGRQEELRTELYQLKTENDVLRNSVHCESKDLSTSEHGDNSDLSTIAAMRKDAERYRWLRDSSESIHQFYLSTPIWFTGVNFSKDTVDSTIDAAMAKDGEQ